MHDLAFIFVSRPCSSTSLRQSFVPRSCTLRLSWRSSRLRPMRRLVGKAVGTTRSPDGFYGQGIPLQLLTPCSYWDCKPAISSPAALPATPVTVTLWSRSVLWAWRQSGHYLFILQLWT